MVRTYLSYIERDLNKNPSIHFLMKIAKPLDVSIEYLLIGVDQIENHVDGNGEKILDKEWENIIEKAIKDGIIKEDFIEYINYIKFKIWKKIIRDIKRLKINLLINKIDTSPLL